MTEEEAYQVECLLQILEPGWTATIARRSDTGEKCWMLKFWVFDWSWVLTGTEFDKAYQEMVKILEAWKWN